MLDRTTGKTLTICKEKLFTIIHSYENGRNHNEIHTRDCT
jgi:hypothetical protein